MPKNKISIERFFIASSIVISTDHVRRYHRSHIAPSRPRALSPTSGPPCVCRNKPQTTPEPSPRCRVFAPPPAGWQPAGTVPKGAPGTWHLVPETKSGGRAGVGRAGCVWCLAPCAGRLAGLARPLQSVVGWRPQDSTRIFCHWVREVLWRRPRGAKKTLRLRSRRHYSAAHCGDHYLFSFFPFLFLTCERRGITKGRQRCGPHIDPTIWIVSLGKSSSVSTRHDGREGLNLGLRLCRVDDGCLVKMVR